MKPKIRAQGYFHAERLEWPDGGRATDASLKAGTRFSWSRAVSRSSLLGTDCSLSARAETQAASARGDWRVREALIRQRMLTAHFRPLKQSEPGLGGQFGKQLLRVKPDPWVREFLKGRHEQCAPAPSLFRSSLLRH